ncbi:hypothetical protein MMC11_004086 [Xylographa trunciseda]|nr:hypothetical protein [Xylographa trunciseda]
MGKTKKAGRERPVQPLGSSLGLVNPFKVVQDHRSARLSARAHLSLDISTKPKNDEQVSQSAIDALLAPPRSVDATVGSFRSVKAVEDLIQNYDAAALRPRVNDKSEAFVREKLSNHVVGRPTTSIAIQENAVDSQFEMIRNNTTGSSFHNTLTITEDLNDDQGGHLIYNGTENRVASYLALSSSTNSPDCVLDNGLYQPSADVLDFLDLRRHFNTWVQLSRLRNEDRHPTLKQYVAAVLEEFEDGYKDLEDKLAEKLFPLSGVRYQKARS